LLGHSPNFHIHVSVIDLEFRQSICLFCSRKYVDQSWEYINRSQTHECGKRKWGSAIPRKGIHKRDFRCSVVVLERTLSYQYLALCVYQHI
jgi:hypothetical protein